jgi:hypothetical protein
MHLLFCGRHWRMVPPALRRTVNTAYAGGEGVGTGALLAAQRLAIRAVNNQLGDDGEPL